METLIEQNALYQELLDLKTKPENIQRYKVFGNKVHTTSVQTKTETDDKIIIKHTQCRPVFRRAYYIDKKNIEGITYDKQTKEVKIWFGKQFYELTGGIRNAFLKSFPELEWAANLSYGMINLINNTILKAMLKGKITNPRLLLQRYLNTSLGKKYNLEYERIYQKLKNTSDYFTIREHASKSLYFTNPTEYLIYIMDEAVNDKLNADFYTIEDMITQAKILNKKINLSWSSKRLNEVHSEWTREIMSYEINQLEQKEYYSDVELDFRHSNLELITNKVDLFKEGSEMKHCVYTNYNSRVEAKRYFVFKYTRGSVRATVGIRYDLVNAELDQMYGIGNSHISDNDKSYVKMWLDDENTQNWFKRFSTTWVQETIKETEMDFLI